jgi:hypothetical protein
MNDSWQRSADRARMATPEPLERHRELIATAMRAAGDLREVAMFITRRDF